MYAGKVFQLINDNSGKDYSNINFKNIKKITHCNEAYSVL